MSNGVQARKIARRLAPDGGWFKGDAESALTDAARGMLDNGMCSHDVEVRLGSVVAALRSEYGE